MLQIALLLLGCVLSRYLWTFSHTIAGVIITVTLFGVTLYVFLTLTATLYHSCPYRTPPSILIQTIIKYLARGDDTFARSLRSPMASFPSVKDLGRILRRLRAVVRSALQRSSYYRDQVTFRTYRKKQNTYRSQSLHHPPGSSRMLPLTGTITR